MKQHQTVVLFVVLLFTSTCFADEVLLKNGKVLRGEVVNEDQEMIILRDTSGMKLYIKKHSIDSVKTEERNKKANDVTPFQEEQQPVVKTQKQTAEKPKKKARVYKKEDLDKLPELTILGSEKRADDAKLRKELDDRAMKEKETETAWNEEALRIDDQIQEAKESYEYNQGFCDKVIPDLEDLRDGPYVRMTAEQYEEHRRVACMEAEDAARDLEKAEAKYESFLEEARKKGIPPGWVDPERIRN